MNYQPRFDLLSNKTILVTGASDGIGREAAVTYSRYGASVILMGRNTAKLQQVSRAIHQSGKPYPRWFAFDLMTATAESCQRLVAEINQHYPALDGVLHNAGILGEITALATLSTVVWQQVMQVNLNAGFLLTQALLPSLLNSGSASLIFTTSSTGRKGRAGWGAYAVSKFATEGLMQVLASEYDSKILRVNCINPGGTRTNMRASAFPEEDAVQLKTPAEIMPLYLYLMGEESRGKSGISWDAQPGRKPGCAG